MKENQLEAFSEEVQRCMRCGFCRAECPTWSSNDWETGSPRGRMQLIKAVIDGKLKVNEYVSERTYQCTLCGYCLWRCPSGVKATEAIKALRALLVDEGVYPKALEPIAEFLKENRSIYPLSPKSRTDWIDALDLVDVVQVGGEAEIIYFPGCVASLSNDGMKVAGATSMIFDSLNLNWAVLGEEEWCCGNPLLQSGIRNPAKDMAEHNVNALQKSKAKVLVTSCAGCYRTFVQEYPRLVGDLGVQVYHTSQLFTKLLKEGKLRFNNPVNMTVAYHDPCELGRLMEIYDPPREVLKAIPELKLVELKKNRNLATCCGGGGMLRFTYPDISLRLGMKKLNEVHEVNAEALVSACPTCEMRVKEAKRQQGDSIEVLDISEIIVRAIGN